MSSPWGWGGGCPLCSECLQLPSPFSGAVCDPPPRNSQHNLALSWVSTVTPPTPARPHIPPIGVWGGEGLELGYGVGRGDTHGDRVTLTCGALPPGAPPGHSARGSAPPARGMGGGWQMGRTLSTAAAKPPLLPPWPGSSCPLLTPCLALPAAAGEPAPGQQVQRGGGEAGRLRPRHRGARRSAGLVR